MQRRINLSQEEPKTVSVTQFLHKANLILLCLLQVTERTAHHPLVQ
jgi:hypothetical protein